MAEKLKIHSGHTLSYDNFQQLLKSASQNHGKKIGANRDRSEREVYNHDVASELTETSNSSEETCNIYSPAPFLPTWWAGEGEAIDLIASAAKKRLFASTLWLLSNHDQL